MMVRGSIFCFSFLCVFVFLHHFPVVRCTGHPIQLFHASVPDSSQSKVLRIFRMLHRIRAMEFGGHPQNDYIVLLGVVLSLHSVSPIHSCMLWLVLYLAQNIIPYDTHIPFKTIYIIIQRNSERETETRNDMK